MRRLLVTLGVLGALVGAIGGFVLAWRRNPRIGTRFVNDVVDPVLVRTRVAGSGRSELGTLEHVGRKSGTRRLTPVHPVSTGDGFRIIVPLGRRSEWAANVVAAGHCRLQLHDVVYDLDEPRILTAAEVAGLPPLVRRVQASLGFEYLQLHTFASAPGALEPVASPVAAGESGSEVIPETIVESAIPIVNAEEALEPGELVVARPD